MEEATRLIAVRHGETAWNVETRIQGQLDIPLNDTGRQQAARLTAALAPEGISAVYSSDLGRALDTARAVMKGAGLPDLGIDVGLRERAFGQFEGHTHAHIESHWPQDAARWRAREPAFGAAGGETLLDFYERCVRCVSRLASAHQGQTIALVSHGGVLDCLYRAATHTALHVQRTWPVSNAAINRLLHTQAGFSLSSWGDVGHLKGLAMLPTASRAPASQAVERRVGSEA